MVGVSSLSGNRTILTILSVVETPDTLAQLAQETYSSSLLLLLINALPRLDFESRKDAVQIHTALLRRSIGQRLPTVEHLTQNPQALFAALEGYGNEEIALNTGMVLKEMLRHESLAKILLNSDQYASLLSLFPCLTSYVQILHLPELHRINNLRHFM